MKPELLLPVGNLESLNAAIAAGADAIYLGLKNFNARGRASNFTNQQLLGIVQRAKKNGVKVHVTLNIVIKNRELPQLIETLHFLSQSGVDAVISQDWGTFSILRQHFPRLVRHASTQMANHNSLGVKYSQQIGFQRVILARELTLPELETIQRSAKIETEIFVHGALCYSFSGMCQFSSFLGGAGANRGLCTQPCRRFYTCRGQRTTFFSLRDNQLLSLVPKFAQLGVASLKVEGRLKSGEYVYTVAQAYRQVIDGKVVALEVDDLARPKTQWFMGHDVRNAIADNPNTGILIGKVVSSHDGRLSFESNVELQRGNRIRIRTADDNDQNAFVMSDFHKAENVYTIKGVRSSIESGCDVFLTAYRSIKFDEPINEQLPMPARISQAQVNNIVQKTRHAVPQNSKPQLHVRIDDVKWLEMNELKVADVIQLSLNLAQLKELVVSSLPAKMLNRIWIELPAFISEKSVPVYKDLCAQFAKQGLNRFVISQLSQKLLLPAGARFATNEQVYAYNDAAVAFILGEGSEWVTSPVENEYDNLLSGACRSQVVPVYFRPKLFYSRMPVKLTGNFFSDDQRQRFVRHRVNGMTVISPEQPVCVTNFAAKLSGKGFQRFLIDLTFERPNAQVISKVLSHLKTSTSIPGTSGFNMKKGLR